MRGEAYRVGADLRVASAFVFASIVAATLPAVAPRDFWALLQEKGPDFDMGSGLLGDFPWVLRSSDFADLGKRCRYVAFLAEFACKTAQKLRAAFAGRKGAFMPDERISVFRSSGRSEQGTEVRSDVRREFDDVIGYDVSKEELVCIVGTLK